VPVERQQRFFLCLDVGLAVLVQPLEERVGRRRDQVQFGQELLTRLQL
jgi:hypothetical protein